MSKRVSATSGQRQWVTIAIGAAVVSTAAALFLPAALGRALDVALTRHGHLAVAVANLALVIAVIALADVAGQLAGPAGSAGTSAWLRRRMMHNLLGLGLPGQRRYPAEEAQSRITTGAAAAGRIQQLTVIACMTVVSALGALIALGLIDWMLPVTLLVGLPAVRLFTYETTRADSDYHAARRDIADRLADALAGLRTIRASGTAAVEGDRVLEPLDRLRAAGSRQHRTAWLLAPLLAILLLAVVAVAGWSLSEGRISAGDFVAAIGYAMIALGTMERLDVFVELSSARSAAARVAEVVADVPVVPRERPLPVSPGRVELRSVSVLIGDRLVLDQCTLTVPAGSTLAVAGRSGAGKSTLVGLLGRLVEPMSGDVLIDGCPVSTMDRAQLRHAVGYAFARPELVGATVAEAIGYAATSRIEPAVLAAHADGLIRRLPAGYRTRLADVPLSDGQRHRIGLARAVAQQPRVLVLDDAVTGLPTDILPGRTRIMVARRAETAAAADRVAWLDNGVIRAIAPHEVLLDEPEYGALWS
jgi:ABC-type multidrug transport system fused ATPase/permease subunit